LTVIGDSFPNAGPAESARPRRVRFNAMRRLPRCYWTWLVWRRSGGEHALQRRAIRRLAMRR
jgi:hypothetical protein